MIFRPFRPVLKAGRQVQKLAKTFEQLPQSLGDYKTAFGAFENLGSLAQNFFSNPMGAASAGPADPGEMVRGTLQAHPFFLYTPPQLIQTQTAPLMVMLHGCQQSPQDFAVGTRMNRMADRLGWRVLYPGQIAQANQSRCWNWFLPDHQHRAQGEPALLVAMIDRIATTHAIDQKRIYIAGLSAGGAAASVMAASYPDRFAAMGIHSGLPCGAAHDMNSAMALMRQGPRSAPPQHARFVPTIIFHGDKDATVHPANGEYLVWQAGPDPSWRIETKQSDATAAYGIRVVRYEDRRGVAMLEYWNVRGLNHAWSGGDRAGSFTDPRGPDATAEMVRFFQYHTLPA